MANPQKRAWKTGALRNTLRLLICVYGKAEFEKSVNRVKEELNRGKINEIPNPILLD